MTIEELEEKMAELEKLHTETENLHAKLKAQIAELKAQGEEKPTPPHPRWKPEKEKRYYTINVGYACAGMNTWDSDTLDEGIYSLGFVFKTDAETEFAIERLKVLAEMREWAGKWDDKVIMYYSKPSDEIKYADSTYYSGDIRFKCVEDARNCVKAVGKERLKKYYFMIPEDED